MLEILIVVIFLAAAIFYHHNLTYTTKHGAPFVGMELDVVERVMNMAKIKTGEVFYELGSGDGRLVISAALRGAQSYGVEIDRLRVLYSRFWLYLLRLHKNSQIIHDDIFKVNLSNADIVCLYLLPETNEKIMGKLKRELKPGTRVISVAFHFPNWEPISVDTRGTIYGPIYLYHI